MRVSKNCKYGDPQMTAVRIYPGCASMQRAIQEITRQLGESLVPELACSPPTDANEMFEQEVQLRLAVLHQADLLIARRVLQAQLDNDFIKQAIAHARRIYRKDGGLFRLRHRGWRWTQIRLRNGLRLRIKTPYLRPHRTGKRGPRRKSGARRANGAGIYPVLAQLGIQQHVSPALREEIALQTVVSDSLMEARARLERDGLRLHVDTLVSVAVEVGEKAKTLLDDALQRARNTPLSHFSALSGRRIQVSIDGGRARTRSLKKGGRVGKNGRRPFTTAWREPRLITLVVLNEKGGQDRRIQPIYVVSLGDADAVMSQVVGLLRHVGAHLAAQVVFVVDGASWLWRRLPDVVSRSGLSSSQVELVLDFWHACEYIHDALLACKNLMESERVKLYGRLRRTLRDEENGALLVVTELLGLARGRRARAIKSKVRYLDFHLEHMNYARLRRSHLPIGSGVVESAIRRVVNQRFKSASQFWRPDHLEPLLGLRALWKSGRWNESFAAQLRGQFWIDERSLQVPERPILQEKAA